MKPSATTLERLHMNKSERMCRECWQPYTIGKRHDCKPAKPVKTASHSPANPHTAALPYRSTSKALPRKPVINVTNAPVTNNDAARVTRWRAKHADHYRRYMRDYMRRYRAEAKENAS